MAPELAPDLAPDLAPTLPRIMVAPNGARRTRADHPALPVTLPELVACAQACQAAGAGGIHAHLRDSAERHLLDAGLYGELLAEMARALPGFHVQITTEAAGRYGPEAQRALVRALRPPSVSIALREILADGNTAETARLFALCAEAGILVQHILYDSADIAAFGVHLAAGLIPANLPLAVLLVLGRNPDAQPPGPADVAAPVAALRAVAPQASWGLCAFGPGEIACLVQASRQGGLMRVGFENNIWRPDGSLATDNAAQVRALCAALAETESAEGL